MEQPNKIVDIILATFALLNKDELTYLTNMLSLEDLSYLCRTHSKINVLCKKYNLIENRARKYITDETPLAEPFYSFRNQVDLIYRNFSTVYTIKFGGDNFIDPHNIIDVQFGIPDVLFDDISNNKILYRLIKIKGLPPKRGTKVYIVGNVHEEFHNFFEYLSVYETLDDIIENFEELLPTIEPYSFYDINESEYNLKNIISMVFDDDVFLDEDPSLGINDNDDSYTRARKRFNGIIENPLGSTIIKEITLP